MQRPLILMVVPIILAAGCGEAPTAPRLDPESVSASLAATGRPILMLDACDPASFNAAFGFSVCNPVHARAGIPFSTFIAQLEARGRVEAWRFAPDRIRVTRPTTFRVPNMGGIVHSFTEVAEFGGGFVPLLNQLSGNLVPAPECVHPANPEAPNPSVILVPPGQHDHVTIAPGENKKFMCCIHPWMRATTG